MNREEYLSQLYGHLRQQKSGKELESIMKYYEEYFDEAGREREAEIISELGTPERLAAQILGGQVSGGRADYKYEQSVSRREWTAGKVILLICLSPIWVSLIIGLAGGAIGLVVGIGGGGVGLIAGGVFSAWCGVTALFTPGVATTMVFAGAGLVLAAMGIAMLVGAVALGKVIMKGFISLCRWMFVGGRGGAAI